MTEKRRSEERRGDPMVDGEQDDIKEEEEEEEEDDDGPPPGFHSFSWQAGTKNLSAEENNVDKVEEAAEEGEDVDENEDIDGPPPGWSPIPQTLHPTHTSGQSCCQVLFQFSYFYWYPKC